MSLYAARLAFDFQLLNYQITHLPILCDCNMHSPQQEQNSRYRVHNALNGSRTDISARLESLPRWERDWNFGISGLCQVVPRWFAPQSNCHSACAFVPQFLHDSAWLL